uniref:Homeobox protein BarH-like 2 n=1 Tax=Sphaerodactylus townsendi TaxID=933632 RepID=A0ACB8EY02_9SAUR
MHCQGERRLASPGQLKAARRRYKTFMIDEILSRETCDYFEKLSLYSVCPSLVVRPKPLHSCTEYGPKQEQSGTAKAMGRLSLTLASGIQVLPILVDS